ncbi:MAG: flavodoxin family protein [Succiniclasticum sp.]|jgi:flavodoxin
MKILIIYSSVTGNTRAVAEAIAKSLPDGADLVPANAVTENPAGYDLVFAGFWAFRRGADLMAQRAMSFLHGQKVAVFGTCGAYPDSDAARVYQQNAAAVAAADNVCLGTFLCQGRVHSYHIKSQHKMESTVQPMTPERKARLEEAEKHPDAQDFANAAAWAAAMVEKVRA